jgi:cell division protein FtsN
MKIRTFSFIIVCALLICSCKHTKKTSVTPQLPEDNSKTEVTVRTESVKPIDPSERTVYKYYVIIGSFRNIAGARQESADLLKKGFTPTILENEDGLYRISAGGYDEENSARARIAGIRAAYEEHRDVWLLVRR